ncbi:hypothetical protein ACIQLK_03575 [Microbacterium sp. NPDC091382]|uniref:hypothetical protein n=1 Tax=Microbacterium sp. NPDC091382 TaxID=3364210 RepID=UPI0037FDCC02
MTAAPGDASRSSDSDGVIELFVGQVLALYPVRIKHGPTARIPPPTLPRIFPRSPEPGTPIGDGSARSMRTRTYTVFVDAPGHGILTVGEFQIEVVLLPLDTETPMQATVFRVATITGRIIEVTGVVIDPQLDAAG